MVTNALCQQRWQYGYVTVYVSIAIYITNYQLISSADYQVSSVTSLDRSATGKLFHATSTGSKTPAAVEHRYFTR